MQLKVEIQDESAEDVAYVLRLIAGQVEQGYTSGHDRSGVRSYQFQLTAASD